MHQQIDLVQQAGILLLSTTVLLLLLCGKPSTKIVGSTYLCHVDHARGWSVGLRELTHLLLLRLLLCTSKCEWRKLWIEWPLVVTVLKLMKRLLVLLLMRTREIDNPSRRKTTTSIVRWWRSLLENSFPGKALSLLLLLQFHFLLKNLIILITHIFWNKIIIIISFPLLLWAPVFVLFEHGHVIAWSLPTSFWAISVHVSH
mmetsp:Transcript_11642/g.43768  ORF Transcript_11642/g.43768 Transcript_11642/m.43768 type:complete len:201 (+) Transcript_11642:867-1469(+)